MTISNTTLNNLTYAAASACITVALWSGAQMQASESTISLLIAIPAVLATSALVAINERRKRAA